MPSTFTARLNELFVLIDVPDIINSARETVANGATVVTFAKAYTKASSIVIELTAYTDNPDNVGRVVIASKTITGFTVTVKRETTGSAYLSSDSPQALSDYVPRGY